MSATKFLVYCKLTCFGGSERAECPCQTPADCELQQHPDFEVMREKAKGRMFRLHTADKAPDEQLHPMILAAMVTLNRATAAAVCPVCNQVQPLIDQGRYLEPHPLTVDGREVPCPGGQRGRRH